MSSLFLLFLPNSENGRAIKLTSVLEQRSATCHSAAMVGVYFELGFGQEGWESDGGSNYTVYGSTIEETQAWGEKMAWDYIHEGRPTGRTLKSIKSTPVANHLLTDHGPKPLDFDEARKLSRELGNNELGAFGLGSGGRVVRRDIPAAQLPPGDTRFVDLDGDTKLPSLEDLRAEIGRERIDFVRETNWDPALQAYYIFTVDGDKSGTWSEAVLCRAANFFHATRIWHWHEVKTTGNVRTACFEMTLSFCPVGESPFGPRRKR